MSDTKVSFFKKPMPLKVFWFLFILIFIEFNITGVLSCFDTDMFFMIPTGNYIIDNGIPHYNVWSIDKSSGFVAQQWLYDVILAVLNRIGVVAIWAFMALQLTLLYIVTCKFCRIKGMSWPATFLCITMVSVFGRVYGFSIRPQVITLILLLIECIALEKYKVTHKNLYLLILPLTVIAEMNLHMSMWFVHFLILFAYLCPAFYFKSAADNHISGGKKAVLLTVLVTIASLFVNPYGFEGVVYLFKSFLSGAFDYITITEMQVPNMLSPVGLSCMFVLIFVGILIKLKSIRSVTLNISLGFTVMMMMALRNIIYLPIIIVYIMSDIFDYTVESNKTIDWKKDVTQTLYIFFVPFILFSISSIYGTASLGLKLGVNGCVMNYNSMAVVRNYLDKNTTKDAHLMTSVNTGAYFEYNGYTNVYVDARPELYTKRFTGDKNIVRDYKAYVDSGLLVDVDFIKKNFTGVSITAVTDADMKAWLDDYDFEYCIIDTTASYLAGYLMSSPDYERVDLNLENDGIILYHRVNQEREWIDEYRCSNSVLQ